MQTDPFVSNQTEGSNSATREPQITGAGFQSLSVSDSSPTGAARPSTTPDMDNKLGALGELLPRIRGYFPEFLYASVFIGFVVMVTFGKVKLDWPDIGYYFAFTLIALVLYAIAVFVAAKFSKK